MILQTGFRTDIPAFTARGLRIVCVQGLCWCATLMIRSPLHGMPSTGCGGPDRLCTKNPAPMLPRMELLRPYGQYWFVTITPYGRR